MPLFIDRHENQSQRDPVELAAIHARDLKEAPRFGVHWITYFCDSISFWTDNGPKVSYSTFCVAEAPDKESVQACHFAAHQRVANEVIEVDRATLEHFLGRLYEPRPFEPWEGASAFRAILVSEIHRPADLTRRLGDANGLKVFQENERIVRREVDARGGKEIRRTHGGLMCCFSSTPMALECALAIQARVALYNQATPGHSLPVHIGINAGEPVS